MRTQHDRLESIETEKKLIESIFAVQIELNKYQQKNTRYEQESTSELTTVIIGLDLLLERILSER